MKKVMFAALAIVLASTASARVFAFGAKAGVDMPKAVVTGNYVGINDKLNVNGFHLGIMAEFRIPIVGIGVQPEVLYVHKKAQVLKFDANSVQTSATARGNYLEIPINLTWGINLFDIVRPFVIAAPTFSYSLSNIKIAEYADGTSINFKKKSNWGIAFGLGCDIWKFQIMAKFKKGLSDLAPEGGQYKENTVSISLGYRFFDI
jgi:hypothetical protein